MQSEKIISADLLDILFEGKNKEYGAYELRKTYNKRMLISVLSMFTFCLLFFLSRILASDNDKIKNGFDVVDLNLESVKDPEEKIPEIKKVEVQKTVVQKVQTIAFTPPQIVEDKLVSDPPPDVAELENTKISLTTQDGVKDDGFVAPPVETKGTSGEEMPKKVEEDIDKIFTKVEKEAKFPGGLEGWKRYLERNLNSNVASEDGAATGNYTVKVQFIVDREGNISSVQAIEAPAACPSCVPEAIKVIKKGPKWDAAIQNGQKVIYQAVQYITFQVAEE